MMDEFEDLQQPDEARPAKRMKLEAPLGATEELQEEMEDDDDWDNIYDDTAPASPLPPALGQIELPVEMNAEITAAMPGTRDDGMDSGGVVIEEAQEEQERRLSADVPPAIEEPAARVMDETSEVGRGSVNGGDEVSAETAGDTVTESSTIVEATEVLGQADAPNYTGLSDAISAPEMTNGEGEFSHEKPEQDAEFLEAAAAQKGTENAEWQFDSSDGEASESDSDSSDDSSSDSGSDGGYEMLDAATAARILMSGDGDDDDGDMKGKGGDHQPRTANEVKEVVIPKPDVTVTADMKITYLGDVERTVDNLVMIKGVTPGEFQVLEPGSVLCNEKREVIGAVAETLGRVQEPFYTVAFTNAAEIEKADLKYATKVYYVDSHSSFVFTEPLKNMKGTDASNIHDEEVDEDELEFSDDEVEAEYKRLRKAAKRGGRGNFSRSAFNEERANGGYDAQDQETDQAFNRSYDAPTQQYTGGLSYDDGEAQEEFYSPLKRPDNLSQLMSGSGLPPRPQQGFQDRGRGRGRGFDRGRGRGDRGRGDRGRGRGGFDRRGGRGGQQQDRGGRGGRGGQNGFRGNAHSFPDRHNSDLPSPRQYNEKSSQSSSPPRQQPSYPARQQYQQPPQAPQAAQTYQFNGSTYQYGNAPAQPTAGYYNQSQQTPAAHAPAQSTANYNQAYYQNQQLPNQWQQQQPQQQLHQQPQQSSYGGWQGQQQQAQQQQYAYAQPGATQPAQPQINLAELMKHFGNYQQNQQR